MAVTDYKALVQSLAEANKKNGLPAGVMESVLFQESGGQGNKFLEDPAKYHYEMNASGKRIAGHTGKESNVFGPFGIMESTGKDPGYGVKPLQNKSLEEQIRFAAEYAGALARAKGSVEAGLASYGEGAAYSKKVMSRISGNAVGNFAAPKFNVAKNVPSNYEATGQSHSSGRAYALAALEQEYESPAVKSVKEAVVPGVSKEDWAKALQFTSENSNELKAEALNNAWGNNVVPQKAQPTSYADIMAQYGLGQQEQQALAWGNGAPQLPKANKYVNDYMPKYRDL